MRYLLGKVEVRNHFVGDEAVNAEDHTTFYGEEEPAYWRSKIEYAQRERERHKE